MNHLKFLIKDLGLEKNQKHQLSYIYNENNDQIYNEIYTGN